MKPAVGCTLLLALLLSSLPTDAVAAEPPHDFGRHRVWQDAQDAASEFVANHDWEESIGALEAALSEAVKFPASDERTEASLTTLGTLIGSAPEETVAGDVARLLDRLEDVGIQRPGAQPFVVRILVLRGRLQSRTGDTAASLTTLRRAVALAESDLGPAHPAALDAAAALADGLFASRPDEAISVATRAVEIARSAWGEEHPALGRLLAARARLHDRRGDRREAVADMVAANAAAGSLSPNETIALRVELGKMRNAAGEFSDALDDARDVRNAIEESDAPQLRFATDAELVAARAHYGLGQLSRAASALERAYDAAGKRRTHDVAFVAATTLVDADIHASGGDLPGAIQMIEQGLSSVPRAAGVRTRLLLALARLEARRGNGRATRRLTKRVLQTASDPASIEPDVQVVRARARLQAGEFAEAERLAARAAETLFASGPGRRLSKSSALQTLAEAQAALGETAEARSTFERALAAAAGSLTVYAELAIRERYAAVLPGGDAGAVENDLALELLREQAETAVDAGPSDAVVASTIERADLNYRFEAPGAWRSWDASAAGLNASVALFRSDPTSFFAIVTTDVNSAGTRLDADRLVDGLEASLADSSETLSREAYAIRGIRGVRWLRTQAFSGQKYYFDTWNVVEGGVFYQLNAWATSRESASDAARELFPHFSFIEATPAMASDTVLPPYQSPHYGYVVLLEEPGWRDWRDKAERFPTAEFAALYKDEAALTVVAVSLFGSSPGLQDLAAGFARLIPGADLGQARRVEIDGRAALEFRFAHTPGKLPLRYRARITSRDGVAYLVLAWATSDSTRDEPDVLDAVESVSFTGHADAARTPADLPDPDRPRHATVYNELGLAQYSANQPSTALQFFRLANESAPDDRTILGNRARVELEHGSPSLGLAAMAGHPDLVESDALLLSLRASLHASQGSTEQALADFAASLALSNDPDVQQSYALLLAEDGRPDEALAHLDEEIGRSHEPALIRAKAKVLSSTGDHQAAVRTLEPLVEDRPNDGALLRELVEAHYRAGNQRKAIALLGRLSKLGGYEAVGHYFRALSHIELTEYREAKEALEAALEREPTSTEVQAVLAQVSALLGEGTTLALKEEIPPVDLPEDVRSFMDHATLPDADESESAHVLYAVNGVRFVRNEEQRTTLWWKVAIRTRQAAQQYSRLEFPYDPLAEEIFVNQLVVRDAEGNELSSGVPKDAYVLSPPQDDAATSSKILHVPVRGLEAGATLEVVLTRRDRGNHETFSYLALFFGDQHPVERGAVFIDAPGGEVRATASSAPTVHHHGQVTSWTMESIPGMRWEAYLPERHQQLDFVRLADATEEWEPLAHDYLDDLAEYLSPDPAIREIADRETQGATSTDAKARALAHFVQETLSYQAIEFGRRARIPNPVGSILDHRYGDCKDHALLLHQLLGSIGIDSRLALASIGEEVDPDLPSLDQFDHMIVRCLGCREAGWLDPTDKGVAIGKFVPRGLSENLALVLDPDEPRLERIARPQDGAHTATTHRTAEIMADGSVELVEDLEVQGFVAGWLRDLFRSVEPSNWEEALESWMSMDPTHSVIRKVELQNLHDTRLPLEIHMEYEIRRAFSKLPMGLFGGLPMVWERAMFGVASDDERTAPFEVSTPVRFVGDVRIRVPDGYRVTGLAGRTRSEGRYSAVTGETQLSSDGFSMTYEIHRTNGMFPASEYPRLRSEAEGVLSFLRHPVQIEAPSAPR